MSFVSRGFFLAVCSGLCAVLAMSAWWVATANDSALSAQKEIQERARLIASAVSDTPTDAARISTLLLEVQERRISFESSISDSSELLIQNFEEETAAFVRTESEFTSGRCSASAFLKLVGPCYIWAAKELREVGYEDEARKVDSWRDAQAYSENARQAIGEMLMALRATRVNASYLALIAS